MWTHLSGRALLSIGMLIGAMVGVLVSTLVVFFILHASLPGAGVYIAPVARLPGPPTQTPPSVSQGPRIPADDPALAIDPELDRQAQAVITAMKQKQAEDAGPTAPTTAVAAPPVTAKSQPSPVKPMIGASAVSAQPKAVQKATPGTTVDRDGRIHTKLLFNQ